MKIHYGLFILLISLVMSGCGRAPSPRPAQELPSATEQNEAATAAPLPTDTRTPKNADTPSAASTLAQTEPPLFPASPTPTLLAYTPEPTPNPPSLSKLQIINRTNVKKLVPVWRYEPPDNRPDSQGEAFAFTLDGKAIAFSVGDHVELFDIERGERIQTFSLDNRIPQWAEQKVYALAFSPGGKRLAGLTQVGIFLWDISSAKPLWVAERDKDSFEAFTKMVFSPAGDVIVTTSIAYGSDTRVWSAQTGKQVKALHMNNQLDAIFNLDGTRLYTVDRLDNIIRAWDTQTWKEVDFPKIMSGYVTLTLSPNGKMVAVNSEWNGEGEQITDIYLLEGWKKVGPLISWSEKDFGIYGPTRIEPSFNRDGGILAFPIAGGKQFNRPDHLELWDTSSLKLISSLDAKFPAPITWAAFSPDGRLLAARSENGTTIFWGIPGE